MSRIVSSVAAIAVIAAIALTAGCATAPSSSEMMAADFGPVPVDGEQIIKRYMRAVLKDPETAQYEFDGSPRRGWTKAGATVFGWVYCPRINGRNSYGGYTGFRPHYFLIRDGAVVTASHGDGSYGDLLVQNRCRG